MHVISNVNWYAIAYRCISKTEAKPVIIVDHLDNLLDSLLSSDSRL